MLSVYLLQDINAIMAGTSACLQHCYIPETKPGEHKNDSCQAKWPNDSCTCPSGEQMLLPLAVNSLHKHPQKKLSCAAPVSVSAMQVNNNVGLGRGSLVLQSNLKSRERNGRQLCIYYSTVEGTLNTTRNSISYKLLTKSKVDSKVYLNFTFMFSNLSTRRQL